MSRPQRRVLAHAGVAAFLCAVLASALPGCAGDGDPSGGGAPGEGPSVEPTPPDARRTVFRGTASYRERILLPEETELVVEVIDLTRSGVTRFVVGRSRERVGGRNPAAFAVDVPGDLHDPAHAYGIEATFTTPGGPWASGGADVVHGTPTDVLCRR